MLDGEGVGDEDCFVERAGLGGLEKRQEVKELVREKAPIVLCIQETKLQFIDDLLVSSVWGSSSHDYSFSSSVGASRGLVTIWDTSEVEVWFSARGQHFLMIHGRFVKSNEVFHLFNVYAPCDRSAQSTLWTSLAGRLLSLSGCNVCLCGDFNYVRSSEERCSVRGSLGIEGYAPFNDFIVDNALIDLPLCGRKFTWFKGNGRSMSRLDRFLLSGEWCLLWPNCVQAAHLRGLSDHCPIELSVDNENWGPRPVRLLKCWQDTPGYNNFVRQKWISFQVSGWGGYVLKEKFKLIKGALKE